MKITIIGAGGVRTPLIVEAMIRRQERLSLAELALMDVDAERLDLVGALTAPLETSGQAHFSITRTTDAKQALTGADFVITTFRVGGIESRVIDERVPLSHGVLGQETTGPGGFAMGLRSIPVLLDYVNLIRECCPEAWLINFANPAGMMTEALVNIAGWKRSVGICDAPTSMLRVAAAFIGVDPTQVYLDYFGLNHLGWVRSVQAGGKDYLPEFIELARRFGSLPGLPFDVDFIASLGMVPNEYLYYYYNNRQAVENILHGEESRGEQIARLNTQLFDRLRGQVKTGRVSELPASYHTYLDQRGSTYMSSETGHGPDLSRFGELAAAFEGEGYAGVALDLIEGLTGRTPRQMILNVPNQGAVAGMDPTDVVEVPTLVGFNMVHPIAVGEISAHCLGLMKQVKAYEKLTVDAAVECSYSKALMALSIHPLVPDRKLARAIVDEYLAQHGSYFPKLK